MSESAVKKPEKFILDATAGFRMMWFNKKHPNCIYLDQRPECEPDIVGDFRDLKQFPDETFRLIIFDPPHIIRNSKNEIGMLSDFGALKPETWQDDLSKGFRELWQKLAPWGILILKWSTQQIPSHEILKLLCAHPLFYQVTSNKRREKSHSNYQTLWFTFMKIPKEADG